MTESANSEAEYLALFAAVGRDWPNTIRLRQSSYPIQSYTCVMHVFEFAGKQEYLDLVSHGLNIGIAGPKFVQWLLEKSLLREHTGEQAVAGDLIFYFNDQDQVKHAGLSLGNGRVESKWGLGQLFDHELFDVCLHSQHGALRSALSLLSCPV
jgi:hypothetical protein